MTDHFYKCLKKITYQMGEYSTETVQPGHIELIRQWRNEQMDVLRQSKAISERQQIEYFEKHVWPELNKNQPKQILLSFFSKNKLIGYGGLVNISWDHLRAEISFLCDPRVVGKVQIYRKCFLNFLEIIRDLSFKTLGLNRLYTETFSFRKTQISILEDFGLDIEGVLKSSYKINGKFCDSVIQSVIKK